MCGGNRRSRRVRLHGVGAVRGVRRQVLSVPGNVVVVGYDGTSLTEFADPALTTFRRPAVRLALEVSRSVIALVGNRGVLTGELLPDPELVVRASTGPVRGGGRGSPGPVPRGPVRTGTRCRRPCRSGTRCPGPE
ncbi:substrate-binding domain-containing protein [Streptomyces sp. NPDC048442]|uniref:substrate-binding domain-containing protein n=1 Tax=Streptomyces sp. NPDC048442 TaxID=3154823 RepID=UPI00342EB335